MKADKERLKLLLDELGPKLNSYLKSIGTRCQEYKTKLTPTIVN